MGLCGVVAMVLGASVVAAPVPVVAPPSPEDSVRVVSERSIAAALEELTPALMSLPGVVGVGEGRCDGEPCLRILVVERSDELVERINAIVRGAPAEIVESGDIRARQND